MRGGVRMRATMLGLMGMATSAPADAACKVGRIAELPVTLIGGRAMVPARFGAHDTRFIVDSGAFYSTLPRASAAEFGLATEPAGAWFRLQGINGDSAAAVARAKDFALVGIADLGQNILGLADVEYDLPMARCG